MCFLIGGESAEGEGEWLRVMMKMGHITGSPIFCLFVFVSKQFPVSWIWEGKGDDQTERLSLASVVLLRLSRMWVNSDTEGKKESLSEGEMLWWTKTWAEKGRGGNLVESYGYDSTPLTTSCLPTVPWVQSWCHHPSWRLRVWNDPEETVPPFWASRASHYCL